MPRTWISFPLLLGAVLVPLSCSEAAKHADERCDNEDWSYERGECGPPWNEDPEWDECVHGDDQSPVDIRDAVLDRALAPLTVEYDAVDRPTVHNNGHTIQVDYTGGTLKLGEQQLGSLQFHVHVPAEHAVEGVRAAMELHIVHGEADRDPAAVVALRFDAGEENPLLAEIWADVPDEVGEAEVSGSVDVSRLLPASKAYWTYSGSLTTPPCTQGLRWLVLEQKGTVSQAQIDAVLERFGENARPLQPINNRPIAKYR